MRRPRVATVLTSRIWEESFVSHARQTGIVRIVERAYRPQEVEAAGPDVVVIGHETAWLTADILGLWSALGIRTIVVGAAEQLAADASVQRVGESPEAIVAAVSESFFADAERAQQLVSVVGPSGSGVTEVACAVATALAPVHLVDRDPPSVALRLNRSPADQESGDVSVSAHYPLPATRQVVVDCGTRPPVTLGRCLLVVAQTPSSYVRAARLIAEWSGPVPELVVNMVRDRRHATDFSMATLGLSPRQLLEYDPTVADAAARAHPPPGWFIAAVREVATPGDA